MAKQYLVYIYTNKINNKVYIGQTCNTVEQRSGVDGRCYLEKDKKGNYKQPRFANAIIKYGWNNFSCEIYKDELTHIEADKIEQELIKKYNSQNPEFGYNLRSGGSRGEQSEESKQKISESNKGKCAGNKHPNYGKHLSEETRERISNARKGKKFTKQHIENMSKGRKGKYTNLDNWTSIPILCVELNKAFPCIAEAERTLCISHENISKVLKKKRNTAGGYHWTVLTIDEFLEREKGGK